MLNDHLGRGLIHNLIIGIQQLNLRDPLRPYKSPITCIFSGFLDPLHILWNLHARMGIIIEIKFSRATMCLMFTSIRFVHNISFKRHLIAFILFALHTVLFLLLLFLNLFYLLFYFFIFIHYSLVF